MCLYKNSALEIIISYLWKIMKTNKKATNKQTKIKQIEILRKNKSFLTQKMCKY